MYLKHRAIFEGVEIATSVYYMAGSECLKHNATFILHTDHKVCTKPGAARSGVMLNLPMYRSISGAIADDIDIPWCILQRGSRQAPGLLSRP